jgi:hypothetical protein
VLLNKRDMLKEGQLASLTDIAKSLNPLAKARAAPLRPAPDAWAVLCPQTCASLPELTASASEDCGRAA